MRVLVDEAERVATALLTAAGAPLAHARIQADSLVGAELRGHPSHGLQRLPRLLDRIERHLADPKARGVLSWRRPGSLHVDGQQGLGPVIAFAAIDTLLERVDDTGIALASVGNSNHLGMLALYVEAVARAGKICIALSTSEALVHPFGGTRAMLGTNPIAIGTPTGGEPFVLDLATSLVSMGKIHDHALRAAPLPKGWALDDEGQPTTNAERAKRGSIAPFGGAKGYGLGLALELLVASLVGSAFAPDVHGTLDSEHVANKGDVFIIIDPDHAQTSRMANYLDAIRLSPATDAERPVSVPGDGARRRRLAALEYGFGVNDNLWRSLTERLDQTSPPLHQELSS
ncbi:Ldh family oxidoreductase [Devosia rhizoryzae]|uniref:Ldh family oxidoreductase n=1 Tax=Devosia rhizoryzae TaxID=2774137 RepID=A0ABX7C2I3_9HYPH|nr:Ldh family oxidoreductase [Devosia rhizoryzae]QQR38286.1 Ldh family oxidoreductase [Devosia rhizoryzae]